jgi:hypothetical protein
MLALLTSAALAFVPIPDNQKIEQPTGPQPIFVVVTNLDVPQGILQIRRTQVVTVSVPVQETVQVNGQQVVVTKYVSENRTSLMDVAYRLDKAAPQTAAGKKLTSAEAAKLIRAGSVILISADGRPIDPLFLRIVNPETVILVPSVPAPAVAPQGPAVPPPGTAPSEDVPKKE